MCLPCSMVTGKEDLSQSEKDSSWAAKRHFSRKLERLRVHSPAQQCSWHCLLWESSACTQGEGRGRRTRRLSRPDVEGSTSPVGSCKAGADQLTMFIFTSIHSGSLGQIHEWTIRDFERGILGQDSTPKPWPHVTEISRSFLQDSHDWL